MLFNDISPILLWANEERKVMCYTGKGWINMLEEDKEMMKFFIGRAIAIGCLMVCVAIALIGIHVIAFHFARL